MRSLGEVLDEAALLHHRARAMTHVANIRTAHGDHDGPVAHAARQQAAHFTALHAVLTVEALDLFDATHVSLTDTPRSTP